MSKFESSENVKKLPGYVPIVERFDKLNLNFIKNNLKNEIIVDFHKEYVQFSKSRNLSKRTLLCKYIGKLCNKY